MSRLIGNVFKQIISLIFVTAVILPTIQWVKSPEGIKMCILFQLHSLLLQQLFSIVL